MASIIKLLPRHGRFAVVKFQHVERFLVIQGTSTANLLGPCSTTAALLLLPRLFAVLAPVAATGMLVFDELLRPGA